MYISVLLTYHKLVALFGQEQTCITADKRPLYRHTYHKFDYKLKPFFFKLKQLFSLTRLWLFNYASYIQMFD